MFWFVDQVEQDTAQSMQMLLQLDGIKSRMKAASDALKVSQLHSSLQQLVALPVTK